MISLLVMSGCRRQRDEKQRHPTAAEAAPQAGAVTITDARTIARSAAHQPASAGTKRRVTGANRAIEEEVSYG
jgi:hypothetical protein